MLFFFVFVFVFLEILQEILLHIHEFLTQSLRALPRHHLCTHALFHRSERVEEVLNL
jgi:hypothetical protein